MTKLLFFLFCFCSVGAAGQDLTGIWRGHFRSAGNRMIEQLLGEEDRYKFEVQLDQRGKQFKGVTYSYKTTVFYGKATCSGAVNLGNKKVILEELKIVELRMVAGSACIMTLFLQYSKSGEEEFLEGSYSSINTTDSSNCGRGTVFLRKVTTSDFYKEPFLVNREKEKEKAIAKKPTTPGKPAETKITPIGPDKKPSTVAAKKPASTSTSPPKKTSSSPTTTAKRPSTTPSTTAKRPSTTPATTAKKPATTPPATRGNPAVKTPVPSEPNKTTTVKVVPVDSTKKIERTTIVTPKVLLTRENELVKTIATGANEITINLYDNGSIDNDTVSVYLDKKLVVTRQRLTEKPISVKFNLDENNMYHELVMVAENLGEIPPNTSLMVVKAGTKQYEVRITSNEQKNAVVIFKYDKGQ